MTTPDFRVTRRSKGQRLRYIRICLSAADEARIKTAQAATADATGRLPTISATIGQFIQGEAAERVREAHTA